MKKISLFILCLLFCGGLQAQTTVVSSPSGKLKLSFQLTAKGEPTYTVSLLQQPIIGTSKLGFFLEGINLSTGFVKGYGVAKNSVDDTWNTVWGEESKIRNHYNELYISLQNPQGLLDIVFRVFDDGVGFRYVFPKLGKENQSLTVMEEVSEFQMMGDHMAWWQPGDWDSNEHDYTTSKISDIDGIKYSSENAISTQFIPDFKAVQTPLAMR